MRDLNYQLKQICRRNRDGSYSTQVERMRHLMLIADQLYDLGFQGMQPRSLKQKHLEANGETIEWRGGLPYADEDKWNSAKSEYCESVGIDFMIC